MYDITLCMGITSCSPARPRSRLMIRLCSLTLTFPPTQYKTHTSLGLPALPRASVHSDSAMSSNGSSSSVSRTPVSRQHRRKSVSFIASLNSHISANFSCTHRTSRPSPIPLISFPSRSSIFSLRRHLSLPSRCYKITTRTQHNS